MRTDRGPPLDEARLLHDASRGGERRRSSAEPTVADEADRRKNRRDPRTPQSSAVAHDFARLATIRFPLILLVVFYHNETGGEYVDRLQQHAPALAALVDWIAYGLGGIRVPAFFLIAGYIFFRDVRPHMDWFEDKFRSRARSVLIPLVAWSMVSLAILAIAQSLPFTAAFFSGASVWSRPILALTPLQLFEAIFGRSPLIYQLWFLRDLFILVLLTPVIYGLIKITKGWITVVSLAVWLLDMLNPLVSIDALFFFGLGCHLAIRGSSIFVADRLGIVAFIAWIVLQVAGDLPKLQCIAGILSVLYLSAWLVRRPQLLNRAARYSFLLFAAHEPLLTFARKLYLRVFEPVAPLEWLIAYFAPVLMVTAASIAAFELGNRATPRLLGLLTGGRT